MGKYLSAINYELTFRERSQGSKLFTTAEAKKTSAECSEFADVQLFLAVAGEWLPAASRSRCWRWPSLHSRALRGLRRGEDHVIFLPTAQVGQQKTLIATFTLLKDGETLNSEQHSRCSNV
jgi:hypothetical protein